MAQVKGTILIDFVKTIKADKSGAYDEFLTDQDREIISQRILPSGWYPYQTFRNCFNASVQVLAKNDMEKVEQWGRLYGEAIITSVYKGLIKEGAPGFGITAVGSEKAIYETLSFDKSPYLAGIKRFTAMFRTGEMPESHEEMLKPVLVLEALQRSLKSGKKETVLS